jgi:heat shock protein HtpX
MCRARKALHVTLSYNSVLTFNEQYYGLVVGLDLLSTLVIAGMAASVLSGVLLVGPLVYWLISRGYSVSRVVRGATFLAALLAIPGLLAVALFALAIFGPVSPTRLASLTAVLLALFAAQYLAAPYLVLYTSKARRPGVEEEWVVELFEEVRRSSGYKGDVELYIVDTPVPNAFAVGNVFKKAVVVHSGLLTELDRDEVKAVLAHELGHIANRDNAYMIAVSLTPFFVYAVGLLSIFLGASIIMSAAGGAQRVAGHAEPQEQSQGAQSGALVALAIGSAAIAVGLLLAAASYLANIGVLAFSRVREHLADMYSVRVTGGTEIVPALKKIERTIKAMMESGEAGSQLEPSVKKALYIIPMAYGELTGASLLSIIGFIMMSSPLSTHPSVEARAYVVSRYYREIAGKRSHS